MKTMRKTMLLIAATLVAAVCIVCLSGLFWIKSGHGRRWVQSRINTVIPGEISIETHRLSLFGPGLELDGVVLHDPQGLALAGFGHLAVEFGAWALWRREIRVSSIRLQDPWVNLHVDQATGVNLVTALIPPAEQAQPETTTSERAGLPFNIVFESIQLTDGRFAFGPADNTTHLKATGISLAADGNFMSRTANLELTADSVRFSSTGVQPQPARITLKAHLRNDALRVTGLDAIAGQTALRLSGSASDLYATPMIDGDLFVKSELSELIPIFNLKDDYAGQLKGTLTLKGPLNNPDAGLVLAMQDARLAGQPLDRGDLSVNLKDRQVEIESAAFRLADGVVRLHGTSDLRGAFPKGFHTSPADLNRIVYDLNLAQEIPDLNPWLNRFVDLSGRMTSRLSLSGKGVTPADISARLSLNASGKDLLAPGMERPLHADVDLSAQIERGKIAISRLDTVADGLAMHGVGHFRMDDQTLDGNLILTAEDLSHALAAAGITFVDGACDAAITVTGSLIQPQFSTKLIAKNLEMDAYTIGNLSIEADLDHDGRLHLTDLMLQNRGSRIQGKGHLRLLPDSGGIDPAFINALDLTLENVSAADFMQAPPMDGALHGWLNLKGPIESLSGELSLTGKRLKADAATIGDVETRMHLADGNLVVDRLHLTNQSSTLTATGNIQVLVPGTWRPLEDPTFAFSASSDHFDPGHFIDKASGDFALNAEVSGSLNAPVGVVTLTGQQAILAGQPLETLSLDARFEARRLFLDQLVAAFAPGEQIVGDGWVGLDKSIDLRIKSTGIAISRIARLNDLFPGDGLLRLDVTGQGHLGNPDVDGRLTVSEITVNDGGIEDIDLTVSLHDMQAKAKGNLNFEMDAACDLESGDFDARLTFDRTEVSSYLKAMGKPDFHGTLTGKVHASGNLRDAANASAKLDLSAFYLSFKDIPLIRSDRMVAQLADQALIIPEFDAAVLDSGRLRLKGDARLGGRMNMDIDGRIPMTAAGIFSDDLAGATGMLNLKGKIAGDTAAPRIDARIDLENIGMALPGLVQKLRDLNGSLHLTPDTIRIEALSGFLDTGSFGLNGTIAHETFVPKQMNLAIAAKSLPLEVPDTLAVLLNGDIQITGNDRTAEARGEIVLMEGIYYKDVKINLLQMATSRQRAVAPAVEPATIPYFDVVNLNIAVGHRQPFVVQNNLAQLEISPELKIGGRLARPVVSGRAQVREGTVTFQKKTFEVTKGVIDFVNPYKTEAEVDIESQAQIRSWKINLGIKGTPDNLDIRLTSQPAETDADILSLILFGRTAQELTAGEGGAQRTTGQIMAEMIADTLGDDIKKTTGLDILQLETTDSSDGQSAAGVKVTVGKRLSDRMTVKYAVDTKDGEVTQTAITEYKLLEHILVSGFQDNKGIYGSELVFRIEFR